MKTRVQSCPGPSSSQINLDFYLQTNLQSQCNLTTICCKTLAININVLKTINNQVNCQVTILLTMLTSHLSRIPHHGPAHQLQAPIRLDHGKCNLVVLKIPMLVSKNSNFQITLFPDDDKCSKSVGLKNCNRNRINYYGILDTCLIMRQDCCFIIL